MRWLSTIVEENWAQEKKIFFFVFPQGYSLAVGLFSNPLRLILLLIAIWMNSRQNRSSVESVDRLMAH